MSSLTSILDLHDYPMIYALQAELTREKGSFNLENQVASKDSFNIFLSEFRELVRAFRDKNYNELRNSIGEVITTILALAYLVDMPLREKDLKDIYFSETIFPREDYLCYVDDIYAVVLKLQSAIEQKDLEQVKHQIICVLAHTYYGLPEFSKFTIRDDLVAITKSALSKIYTTNKLVSPEFDLITDERTIWHCYPNIKFKALALLEVDAA